MRTKGIFFTCIVSCKSAKEIQGYWVGEDISNNITTHSLIKIEDGRFVEYASIYRDATPYFVEHDIFIVRERPYYSNFVSRFTLSASEFKLFDIESDTLIATFKRSKERHAVFDLLNDKRFISDLPIGRGITEKVDNNHRITFLVYLKYIDGKLTANYNNKIIPLDSNFYMEALKEALSLPSDEKGYIRHFIIANRNIKMKDILFVEEQLKFAGYGRVSYLLESSEYDEVNRLSMLMRPLEKSIRDEYRNKRNRCFEKQDSINKSIYKASKNKGLEIVSSDYEDYAEIEIFKTAYPSFNKENTILLKVDKESMFINDKIISTREELKNILTEKLLNNPITQVFYYVDDNAKYQDFINVLGDVKNTIIELRTQYLQFEYKLKYAEYFDESKRKLVKESKTKYPFIFWQISEREYNSFLSKI